MNKYTHPGKTIIPSLVCVLICLSPLLLGQGSSASGQFSQGYQGADEKGQPLFRIEIEDSIEAGLIEQQLKIRPAIVRTRSFYYYGNEENNELLRRYGYQPVRVNREDLLTRTVRVIRKEKKEEDLARVGATIVLREREYWIVRATLAQLRLLDRLGYSVEELGRREPRPRQIRIVVAKREQVEEVGALRVDIYSTTPAEQGFVILGGAFDDSIDELRRLDSR